MYCTYLTTDIPAVVSRIKLRNSLLVPPHAVRWGCIVGACTLDDERSVATIAFSDTPKRLWDLNCDLNGFPSISTFGTLWRAVDLA